METLRSAKPPLRQRGSYADSRPAWAGISHILIRRGGEVETLRSAKPPCAGSIPAHASQCRGGGIGRHEGLKILCLRACGFNSRPRHKRSVVRREKKCLRIFSSGIEGSEYMFLNEVRKHSSVGAASS